MSKSLKECKSGVQCSHHKLGTCKFSHKGDPKATHVVKHKPGPRLKCDMTALLRSVSKNLNSRKALEAEIAAAKSTYFDVKDCKDVTPSAMVTREMKLLTDELTTLRNVARGMFKQNQTFKLNTTYTWQISIAVTTGLVTGVQTVDPSGQSEWIAAAGLFDEYKVDGATLDCRVKQAVNYSSGVLPWAVVSYDAMDSAGLSSVQAGMACEQHLLIMMPSTYEAVAGSKHPVFRMVVPKGEQTGASNGVGNWLPVSNPLAYGWLKFYCNGDNITAVSNGGFGAMVTVHCSFRIRE